MPARAGGKGSDLEKWARPSGTTRFFEMLGNFSFGDYFKTEAVHWAWEFHHDRAQDADRPAVRFGVQERRRGLRHLEPGDRNPGRPHRAPRGQGQLLGPGRDSGACGPCSEIYYDLGAERGCGSPDCKPGCDCERYLEFWNLVFRSISRTRTDRACRWSGAASTRGWGWSGCACSCRAWKATSRPTCSPRS